MFLNHLRWSMLWYSSDQAQEFDRYLRIPFRDIRVLQKAAGEHYERAARIDPGDDVQLVYDSFTQFLEELDRQGESSERLILWFAALSEIDPYINQPVMQGHPAAAAAKWIKTLEGWARKDMLDLRFDVHGIDRSVADTYREQVYRPVREVWNQLRQAGKHWRESERNRSAWDNYLWRIYYEEIRTTPAAFLFYEFERMKHREWWRQVRARVDETQQRGLLDELIENLYETDLPVRIEDWTLMVLEEAFDVGKYPVFDEVAKDW